MSKPPKDFVIYEGELSDAPGRDERWTEWVWKLGEDSWRLWIAGVAAGSAGYQEESDAETFTTEELVGWCHSADTDWGYSTVPEDRQTYPRLEALEGVAKALGDDKLLAALKECRAPE